MNSNIFDISSKPDNYRRLWSWVDTRTIPTYTVNSELLVDQVRLLSRNTLGKNSAGRGGWVAFNANGYERLFSNRYAAAPNSGTIIPVSIEKKGPGAGGFDDGAPDVSSLPRDGWELFISSTGTGLDADVPINVSLYALDSQIGLTKADIEASALKIFDITITAFTDPGFAGRYFHMKGLCPHITRLATDGSSDPHVANQGGVLLLDTVSVGPTIQTIQSLSDIAPKNSVLSNYGNKTLATFGHSTNVMYALVIDPVFTGASTAGANWFNFTFGSSYGTIRNTFKNGGSNFGTHLLMRTLRQSGALSFGPPDALAG